MCGAQCTEPDEVDMLAEPVFCKDDASEKVSAACAVAELSAAPRRTITATMSRFDADRRYVFDRKLPEIAGASRLGSDR